MRGTQWLNRALLLTDRLRSETGTADAPLSNLPAV